MTFAPISTLRLMNCSEVAITRSASIGFAELKVLNFHRTREFAEGNFSIA
jgi:hypothetical protein